MRVKPNAATTLLNLEFNAVKPNSLIPNGSVYARTLYSNGYGASVLAVRAPQGFAGAFEVAVLLDGRVNTGTPLTNDVMRVDSPEGLNACLRRIADLPPHWTNVRRTHDRALQAHAAGGRA